MICILCVSPLQEAILEEQESQKDDNIHLTRFLRVLANFLVLCCLAGSGYLIYFVVRRSQKFALDGLDNHTWWERNEVAMRDERQRIKDTEIYRKKCILVAGKTSKCFYMPYGFSLV